MFIEERHEQILAMLEKDGRVSIGELQEKFDISLDSARRDLRILEGRGLLRRTHGGAIPVTAQNAVAPKREPVAAEFRPGMEVIAREAAAQVRENDVVYLNSGIIGALVLKELPKQLHYTLVVNSAALADQLKYWENVEVYLTGGKLRMHGSAASTDVFAADFVRNLHFSLCLMTGTGLDADFGFSNSAAETAEFQKLIIANADRRVLMLSGRKLGEKAQFRVCGVSSINLLITDEEAAQEELEKLCGRGLEIRVAKVPHGQEWQAQLRNFMDEAGRLTAFPARRKLKNTALFFLAAQFETGRDYTEQEVNRLLNVFSTFRDPATLRRELVGNGFLVRTPDCSVYRKPEKQPTPEQLGLAAGEERKGGAL